VHDRLRQIAVRIVASAVPSTTRRVLGLGSTAGSAGEQRAAQQPGRWTCTYEDHNGVHAGAAFRSAPEALDFAEQHARLLGLRQGEWTRHGDTWLLTTPHGDYLVREQSEQQARLAQRQ
jgi:hypothetical protein